LGLEIGVKLTQSFEILTERERERERERDSFVKYPRLSLLDPSFVETRDEMLSWDEKSRKEK